MAEELTEAEVDELVYEALTEEFRPYSEFAPRIPVAPIAIYDSLKRLMADNRAALTHGLGWRRLRKVVPNPPQGNVEKHDYEPDTEGTRYRGDPHCRVCGEAKRMPVHNG